MLFVLVASLLIVLGLAPAAGAAHVSDPVQGPNTLIDGPDAAIVSLSGMSIARDGTGGLVYLKDVSGVAHVFMSRLLGGGFQAPIQVDAGLLGPSSQPVIAAGNGGALELAFINGGALYVAQTLAADAPLTAPAAIFASAANPSISMSNFGKVYLAFTATNGAGSGDVRAAYYYHGQWALEAAPLDANPADAAGTGGGRPDVVAAGDGVGIVAWGENGHIYTRRVTKTTPSVVDEQADVPALNGWQEVSARDPVISAGGDSSYASVAFQEEFANGGGIQSRVLLNRLHGSQYDGIQQGDGAVTGGPEGADEPATAVTEYGRGFVTSEHDQSHQLFAATLASDDAFRGTARVDSLPNGAVPDAVPAAAGLQSTLIAWQQTPGSAGPAEIRLRYAADGVDLGPEQVVSSPTLGATDAASGLMAGGDVAGDAAIAWVQGSGAGTYVVAAQLYHPPGGFAAAHRFSYVRSAQPALAWSAAAESWGPTIYTVRVDGVAVAQTAALEAIAPAPLANGRHNYQVTAVNRAGLTATASPATVFVDTVHPRVSLKIAGMRIVGSPLRIVVAYSDPPPRGLPRADASGVATVYVNWGVGKQIRIRRNDADHTYTRGRAYTVTVTATDRAGNKTVVKKKLTITAKSKPKSKPEKAKTPPAQKIRP